MSLSPGTRLGPYEIVAPVGAGGMGEVYKARDTRLRRDVAIKVSPERFTDRFEREARAIAALNHPNICTLHDVGPDYLVMELVDGRGLDDVLKQGALPLEEALHIARQIAEALEAAHEKGIIHRDLKPGNIIVTGDGVVKVLDFGLAKLPDPTPPEGNPENSPTVTLEQVTRTGTIMGTAAYMAPEQARGTPVDKRADIWAFGVVLYEMLTGKRLFHGETTSDTLAAILTTKPDWNALPATSPPRIRHLLQRCLERDRKQRLQDIGEARIAIDTPGQDTPPQPAVRKPRWGWLAATGGALVVAAIGGWWLRAPQTAPSPWTLTRLTADAGLSDHPVLSPDGKTVAYVSDRGLDGSRDLYIKQVAGGQPIRLTSDGADNTTPDFSPDGSKIVFRSNRDGGGVYEISAFGGDVRLLARDGLDPKFSPDGTQVAYWIGAPGVTASVPGSGSVWVVPVTGGPPQRVGSNFTTARYPVWAPDGKHLLVTGYTAAKAYDSSSIDWWLLANNASGAAKTGGYDALVKAGLQARNPTSNPLPRLACWSATRNTLVFSVASGDVDNLWEIGISPRNGRVGGLPNRLTTGAGDELNASCAPGGNLVFTVGEFRRDVWSLPFDLDRGIPQGAMERITQGPAIREHASLSNNGRVVAFGSDQSGIQNVWVRDLVTGRESIVANSTFVQRFPAISPTGERVAYSAFEKDKRVVNVSAPGGSPEKLCDGCLRATDWSTDEKTVLVFAGNPYQISALDVASRHQTPLLKHASRNLLYGRFSPDGRWLSFTMRTDTNRGQIVIAPIDGPKPVPESAWITIAEVGPDDWANWSPDGKTLYFISGSDGHRCLWAQRLDPSSQRPIDQAFAAQHFHGRLSYGGAGWSAAGGRFGIVLAESTGNIWMMSRRQPR